MRVLRRDSGKLDVRMQPSAILRLPEVNCLCPGYSSNSIAKRNRCTSLLPSLFVDVSFLSTTSVYCSELNRPPGIAKCNSLLARSPGSEILKMLLQDSC